MRNIYIYQTPASKQEGLIKIGDAHDVESRIKEQLVTAGTFDAAATEYRLLFNVEAVSKDGTEFRDHQIHAILESKGYPKHQIVGESGVIKGSTEWFKVDPEKAIHLINEFIAGVPPDRIDIDRFQSFAMRPEQSEAVNKTSAYFASHPPKGGAVTEMLWNAKMRFGKTFAAYQLALKEGYTKVLVLTYKPAVEDAWRKDLQHHADFKPYTFLRGHDLTLIPERLDAGGRVVAFASYQDLLGTEGDDSEIKNRHKQLFETQWDVVIIDEFHYGTGTAKARQLMEQEVEAIKGGVSKADKDGIEQLIHAEEDEDADDELHSTEVLTVAEKSIKTRFRLFLSGTPFKAIADARFNQDAIFNWTYTDEQSAKAQWSIDHPGQESENPYRSLPQIQMYLYKVSDDLIQAGIQEDKDEFSLNHFFKASKSGVFDNPESVRKWLDLISGVIQPHNVVADEIQDEVKLEPSQYPYDHKGTLMQKVDHTLWYLNRVSSAEAMAKMLAEHPVFSGYHIILAAGKGLGSGIDAVQPVLDAIESHKKTITLSVGKLTTGVSVPKWKGVMFLRDIASPENYFQTAFRAQTPWKDIATNAIKEVCYIFDFSPNRSLRLLTTYSEKLTTDGHLTTSEERIGEFIRYLPVLKVTGNQMVSMDAREVLTFDLSGIDAKGLGARFAEKRNVVVTRDVIAAINADADTLNRCQQIFDSIKKFRKFNGASEKELADSNAELGNLDVNDKKIKDLSTKESSTPKEKKAQDKELEKAEKELKSEREKVRELMRVLLSRIPIFMYLTDATEENLEQILIEDADDLFRKTTGIQVDDFRFLVDVGLIKIESLDGYILKFVQLESQNFDVANSMRVAASF